MTETKKSRLAPSRRKSFFGQLVLVLITIQLAFFGSFTCLNLPTGTGSNLTHYVHGQVRSLLLLAPPEAQTQLRQYVPAVFQEPQAVRYSTYVPLAPTAVLVGYVLGPALALMAVGIFLLIGLLGPLVHVFPLASGGGLQYYLEPGFGYLLGMVAGAGVSGWTTMNKRTSLSQVVGVILGLAAIHLTGIVYLFGSYLYFYIFEGSKAYTEWQPWIFSYLRNLSWYALPYDFILSIMAIGLAFPFRWLVQTLLSTDTVQRAKPVRYSRKELERLNSNA